MAFSSHHHRQKRRGLALFLVVLVVALLTLAGYAFVALMSVELDTARQRGREIQVQYVTQSGISLIETVAAASPLQRGLVGGTYDNPKMFCAVSMTNAPPQMQMQMSPEMLPSQLLPQIPSQPPGRVTVIAPRFENGRFTGVRYGLVNESSKLHLAKVLEWENAKPGDGINALRQLPGMTDQIAESILDWIDADDMRRPGGAEAADYAAKKLPYRPRNAVPVSLEEFLLVQGVTRLLMFGDDENFNFVPDSLERNQTGPGGSVQTPSPAIPWVHLLTVTSAERDADRQGRVRIDLNQSDLSFLHTQLKERLGEQIADFVVLYRQYGPQFPNAGPMQNADTVSDIHQPASTITSATTGNARTRRRLSRQPVNRQAEQSTTQQATSEATPLETMNETAAISGPADATIPEGTLETTETDATPSPATSSTNAAATPDANATNTTPEVPPDDDSTSSASNVDAGDAPATQATPATPETSLVTDEPVDSRINTGDRMNTGSRINSENRFGQDQNELQQRTALQSSIVDFNVPAKFMLKTPLDIVNATVMIPPSSPKIPAPASARSGDNASLPDQTTAQTSTAATSVVQTNGRATPQTIDSPLFTNASSLNGILLTYLDEVSASPATTIVGRININEAPQEVLAAIPGLTQNMVRQILTRRERPGLETREIFRQPTWLLVYDIVDFETLKNIWPHITCGGDIFRGQVIGFYDDTGTFARGEVAIDATVLPPRQVYYKDLTSYGIGFNDRVLFGTDGTANQSANNAANVISSPAPTAGELMGDIYSMPPTTSPNMPSIDGFGSMNTGMNSGMGMTQNATGSLNNGEPPPLSIPKEN